MIKVEGQGYQSAQRQTTDSKTLGRQSPFRTESTEKGFDFAK